MHLPPIPALRPFLKPQLAALILSASMCSHVTSPLADHRGTGFAEGDARVEPVRCHALEEQAGRMTGGKPPYPPQGTLVAAADCTSKRFTVTVNVTAPLAMSAAESAQHRSLNKMSACVTAMWVDALDHGWSIRFELRLDGDLIGKPFEIAALDDCGKAVVAMVERTWGPEKLPEPQAVERPPPSEAEQEELQQFLRSSLSGKSGPDTVTVSGCELTISTTFERPCSAPAYRDFVAKAIDLIDLGELDHERNALDPWIFGDNNDLIMLEFKADTRRRISEINQAADPILEQTQRSHAPDRLRPLSERYEDLLQEFSVTSRETVFYCSGDEIMAPKQTVVLHVRPDSARELLDSISDYGKRHCAR